MTHTAKHTPGPWVVDEVSEDNAGQTTLGIYADPEAGNAMGYICGIHCAEDVDITDTDLANATLIAAAPAMYEALQQSLALVELAALEEWGRAVRGEQQPPTTEARDRLEKVKAALAQAEGVST